MIRVRFAPSPTGFLHIGSARTALFNWLYARSTGGTYLLRVEDTDKVRSEERFLHEILEDLKWLGLDWDEEPIRQSERFDIYLKAAADLVNAGKGYREGDAYIFKVEKGRTIQIDDLVHGTVIFNTDDIKDQVMIKSDGSPAYNFCCVVDDAFLKITHIIRGDDHMSNTPKQVLFYEALGLTPPRFGHMPLIMGADGAKLSKRHGGVSVEEYKRQGFLPEALVNYLLRLGWSPGDDREIMTLKEAAKIFTIDAMTGVQAKFDLQKLTWMNGEYIKAKSDDELLPLIKNQMHIDNVSFNAPDDILRKVIVLYKMRIKTLGEFAPLTDHFFTDAFTCDEKGREKYCTAEGKAVVREYLNRIENIPDFTAKHLEDACRIFVEEKKLKAGQLIHPTRIAISGKTIGAGLFEMMEVLGRSKVLQRMRTFCE